MKQNVTEAAASAAKKRYKAIMDDVAEVEKNIYVDPETGEQLSKVRGLKPSMAAGRLRKDSDKGEFAAPGQGDQGQFYKKGGEVSSASKRGDGIAKRGKTKGRMC
jgi:hypothetical protein